MLRAACCHRHRRFCWHPTDYFSHDHSARVISTLGKRRIFPFSIINADAAGTPSVIFPVPSSCVPPQRISRLFGASHLVPGVLVTNCAMFL